MSAPQLAHDSDLWLEKDAAAALAGVAVRQLERRAAEGLIAKKQLPRAPGERVARVVYSRDSIERYRAGERPVSNDAGIARRAPDAIAPAGLTTGPWRDFAQVLSERLSRPRVPAPPVWLDVDAAAAYSGLPRGFLLRAAVDGRAECINVGTDKSRRWRFLRDGLARVRA